MVEITKMCHLMTEGIHEEWIGQKAARSQCIETDTNFVKIAAATKSASPRRGF